jgi:hypothetical protein
LSGQPASEGLLLVVATDDVIERPAEALRVVVTGKPEHRAALAVEEQQGRRKLDALIQGEVLDSGRAYRRDP